METVTEGVVLTFVVVVTHLSGWCVYGSFDVNAGVFARFGEATFKGVDDCGGCFLDGVADVVMMVMTAREFDVKFGSLDFLDVAAFGFAVAVYKEIGIVSRVLLG
jgi:hypothetical protein